ncbi:MAG: DUF935 domain-containing protein [Deltaproteobacteria bacterium]|nr:DUF935 domain-containing protein [Deltaproteobacteria bacterium]MCL4873113.1 DUF935 family protein [bacterium]
MLYDGFGRELRPEKRSDERVLAVATLRDRWSGYPSKGLTPEKLGAIFREADSGDVYRQAELFEEMEEKDGHLFSILQTRKLAVTGLDFEIEPFSQERKDIEIADFVRKSIFDLPDFEDNLLDMLDAIGKGFSALEIYWEVREGKNVARHLEWVHPKRFTWANTLHPRLLTEEAQANGIDLPPFKFLFHLHKARSGYPTRQGLLRTCAWMYLFKNYDIKDWVAFAEVYGMPLRLGKYDPGATKEDKEALIQAVRSLGHDAAGVISKSTEIEFVEAVKNSGEAVYETLARFCDAQMSKAVLGHSAGADSTAGKLGNENQAGEVRQDLKRADCEMVSKTMRRDLFRPIVGFNFGWDAGLPWLRFKYQPEEDLKEEAEKINTLTSAGVRTIPVKWVHERFGIPLPKEGEETVAPVSPAPAFPMKAGYSRLVNKAGNKSDTVDALTERLLDEADLDALMEPVRKLLAEAGSMEDFRDRLLDAFEGMDPVKIGNLLQRAFAAAELLGRYEAE